MAFWGVKLKPKKPFLISEDELDGRRLHITQATLGLLPESDDNPQRSVVKCRTGDNPAIFMCSLKPGLHESVPLNLFFDDTTAFFVTGPAAVHLCGYFEDMSDEVDDDEDMSDDSMDDDFIVGDDEILEEEDEEDEEDEEEEPVVRGHNVRIVEITDEEGKSKEKLAIEPTKLEEKSKQNGEASEDEDGFPTKRKTDGDDDSPNKKAKTSDTPGTPSSENQSGKKKKKKKGKKQDGEGGQPVDESKEKSPATKGKSKSDKKRFANGLEIENLTYGKPDGKQAKPGKKVSIHYIGKLVKNGQIFDSTVGKRPFPFRLGVNEVIRGFDIGVAGMRIGDKRRVTIPPSMGYGDKSVGPIPPGSWLCFDIELVDVK